MIYKYVVLGVLLTIACVFDIKGQASKTPFSSFGVGQNYSNALAYNQAIGGTGVGTPDYLHFNSLNPASLTFNRITVLEAGFVSEYRVLKNNTISEQNSGANINYFAWGFPVKQGKWTTGIGIAPYTYMKYNLHYNTKIESKTHTADLKESGNGGISQCYWSNGVALYKNLSVGLQASYFFGSLTNQYSTSVIQTNDLVRYTSNIFTRQSFSGFGFSIGFLFHLDSVFGIPNYQFNAGTVYTFKSHLETTFNKRFERKNGAIIVNSTTLSDKVVGSIKLPQSLAGGISFGKKNQWLVGLDATYTLSSQFVNFDGNSEGLQDSWKISLGGWFSPKLGISNSYFNLITYLIGFSFEKTPYIMNNNKVNNFGVNIGLSLPVAQISSITLVAQIGKQGDISTNAIEENYFRLYCGVTFNDKWFIKRRFD